MRVTPWEAIVVATDVAVKAADVQVGFMDRFSGALIILGGFIAGDDRSRRSCEIFS